MAVEPEASIGPGQSAIFGYAVLRANFDYNAPSYLDNFSGFVLDVLADRYPDSSNESAIAQAILLTFGLTIPDKVVGRLLRKLAKAKKITAEKNSYRIEESARSGLVSLRESMAKFESQQAELLTKFTDFVKMHHGESSSLIDADPGLHLHAFIDRHAAPLLRRGVEGRRDGVTPWGELQGAEYLVGSFVLYLEAHDAVAFGYLIDAVKGAILTGVLEMGPGDLKQSLRGLTIVLDTPILLSALGYQGTIPQRAAEQMLQLARKLKVQLVCFEHTEKELYGVLDAAIAALRVPSRSAENWRSVSLHFIKMGAAPSDIAIEQNSLHSNLQRLGVRAIPRPDTYYSYGLDENALEDLLRKELPTQRDSTRLYDLQSISALHRLRQGSSPDSFERCGHVFVTDNFGLTTVARQVDERHLWPLVMLENDVASLLWVRSPVVAEDLPRQQLLATVYTGMQPAPHLWLKYVAEIERLEAKGDVNPDEGVVLRSRPEARDVLMNVTLGDTNMMNAESMEVIVGRVREQVSSPYKHEADSAIAARDKAKMEAELQRRISDELRHDMGGLQTKLTKIETERQFRDERIRQRAARSARRIIYTAIIIAILILISPEVLKTADSSAVEHLPAWISFMFSLLALAVAGLGYVRMFIKGTVLDWLAPTERRLAAHIERRSRISAALPPLRSDE